MDIVKGYGVIIRNTPTDVKNTVVYQELTRITKSIKDGDFFTKEAFVKAIENCKKNDSCDQKNLFHIVGVLII